MKGEKHMGEQEKGDELERVDIYRENGQDYIALLGNGDFKTFKADYSALKLITDAVDAFIQLSGNGSVSNFSKKHKD